MVFGALVACAGLVLLYLRKEQARNRIRLFGQDFQISTPDLVVFLAGCGIFVIPLLVSIKNDPAISIKFPWQSKETSSDTVSGTTISSEEKEPNDQISTANLSTIGAAIKGSIATGQDRDFFKLKTIGREPTSPGQVPNKIRVILRKTSPEGFTAVVGVYDEAENKITESIEYLSGKRADDPSSLVFDGRPNSYYYIMVRHYSESEEKSGNYQLVVREE